MSWQRMRFRGQSVWVHIDDAGKPIADAQGRAEMKYRLQDDRLYKPSTRNLESVDGEIVPDSASAPAKAPEPDQPKGPRRTLPAAPAKPLLAADGDTIHVWTDGACTGNPGPMGIGVVVITADGRRELGEYLGVGTNNIAELTAIQRGLEIAAELDPGHGRPVRVYSDSAYSIGLLSQNWKAKANQELVARLRTSVARFPSLHFVKVAGHAGIPENERCDELARHAIERRS